MFDPFHTTRLRRRPDQPGHRKREGIRDLGYEQLPRQQRSLLDGGPSRRNLVLRYPTREYEPDHASRTRQACRPLSRANNPKPRKPSRHPLTNVPPYEPKAALNLRLPRRRQRSSVVYGPVAAAMGLEARIVASSPRQPDRGERSGRLAALELAERVRVDRAVGALVPETQASPRTVRPP